MKRIHMNDVVITAAVRTAVGKFNGTIAKVPAVGLGALVLTRVLPAT
jgi:acetyl-CoA C-acetyltransferase